MARPIEKRDDIENAVVTVVARKGLRGSTIQDISAAASVSPGLLYRYWRNRDELAADVYRKRYSALVSRLGREALRGPDLRGQVRALVHAFLAIADEEPDLLRFLLLSQHDLAGEVPEELGVRGMVSRLLADGMASGVIRDMDRALAMQIFLGMVLQPVVGALYGDLSRPLVKHADAIYAALERALFVPESSG
jgi:AcrR family transcriptional regulator